MREQFERDGFLVVERALREPQLSSLVAAVDDVWRARRPEGGALHELGFVGADARFVELVDQPSVLPLVRDVLGWNIFVYHCHLDVHPAVAAPAGDWRWHQDGGRQNVDLESPRPRLSVKVAYFLTDVDGAEDGAMLVVPGSHRRDVLDRSTQPRGAVPLCVRAGSAVVFDRRLWHARGDNTGTRTRKALFYAYTYRWIRARDDFPAVDDAFLACLEPVRRQLLGAGTTLGCWFPTDEEAPLRMR